MPEPTTSSTPSSTPSSVRRLLAAVAAGTAVVLVGTLGGPGAAPTAQAPGEADVLPVVDGSGRSTAGLDALGRAGLQASLDAGDPARTGTGAAGDITSIDPELLPHAHGGAGAGLDPGLDAALADADPSGATHRHDDPATKNAVSRTTADHDPDARAATDPTTRAQAAAHEASVIRGRTTPEPRLTTVPVRSARRAVPEDRYAMAGGCYTLRVPGGPYVARATGAGTPLAATARSAAQAARFSFRAADLGVYLLYATDRTFVGSGGSTAGAATALAAEPSPATEWTAYATGSRRAGTFTLQSSGAFLRPTGGSRGGALVSSARPASWRLDRASGCTAFPEPRVGVSGDPHAGVSSFQEVRGYIDPHTHGMAYEFLGGRVHCGKPWDRYGVEKALVDCPDHTATGGTGALLELALSGRATHDPVGWPTFKDWPAPDSLTHEGTYLTWMERSWRAGQRVLVNLLVENGQLCNVYPLKKNSCDDMVSIRLQAKRMREFERYVDAQFGGPGKGWYRIVRSPYEARRVINAGKLAVIMGIETSVPFGCSLKLDQPQCDVAAIDRQLDEMHRLGVRQMELVNKFDNALSGVAGDEGPTGLVINGANFLETGSFWRMEHCEPRDGESADKTQVAFPDVSNGQQDALFGAVASLGLPVVPAVPLYPTPLHCNARGLSKLGEHLVNRMADKHMLIDPDHMSVKGRQGLLDVVEARRYPGVVSSHSWSTPDAYPRVYRLGGFVGPYAGDSKGFYDKWVRHLGWADPRYYFGFGFGADINGLGAQGNPRGADVPNPVTYPFTGLGGVTVSKQVSGQRVYDVNVDGVAHYGLYPDWIQDLRQIGGPGTGPRSGSAIAEDMARGPEAYLQTWERAEGVRPDPCRNPELRRTASAFAGVVRPGMTTTQVMRAVGQPYLRLDTRFVYCVRTGASASSPVQRVRVRFTPGGRVTEVVRVKEA